ncbi:hypothetical protein NEOLI_003674 [Neolecta irregularis DAH-3]|uniref:BTB domain-containing protein n=1 Tax=Neolecta irregularis (strain DAH-3) TaxID=1198029 RepID=A0A1U7LQC4_NEOID|nr:hypothetical protein NEOLI_003674 [Neolecta irregularis DAH-3]|eukprot:OLL24721.1 hypothetical protein NEOLI_003674 [Neolecta irregularis DAH-3]
MKTEISPKCYLKQPPIQDMKSDEKAFATAIKSDTVLQTAKGRYYVSSLALRLSSPVFAAMLEGGFSESVSIDTKEEPLNELILDKAQEKEAVYRIVLCGDDDEDSLIRYLRVIHYQHISIDAIQDLYSQVLFANKYDIKEALRDTFELAFINLYTQLPIQGNAAIMTYGAILLSNHRMWETSIHQLAFGHKSEVQSKVYFVLPGKLVSTIDSIRSSIPDLLEGACISILASIRDCKFPDSGIRYCKKPTLGEVYALLSPYLSKESFDGDIIHFLKDEFYTHCSEEGSCHYCEDLGGGNASGHITSWVRGIMCTNRAGMLKLTSDLAIEDFQLS